ncbi:energy transducer TonB [Flagellimonas pacifica]|uniref:Protein TonB n=1 Tax=Flagellimonas pacifica TaxID=1247520 RepID=A0A285MUQ2_9FLAO|nr:energy transducer TonB [Allomuricauda parva]SNZ00904.1 protein TonB [Allomuricauda parva]
MEFKKNPKLELKKNSALYFLIGLTAILLFAYVALEWKTFYKTPELVQNLETPDGIDEILPPVLINLPPPPPPKIIAPPVIEIIADDDETKVETFIDSDDSNQDTEIMDVEDVVFVAPPIEDEVIFIKVEDPPVFPGCENENTKEGKRACFQEMMQKHIRKNFRYPEMAQEMRLQGRVSIMFTIQKDGSIDEVRMRGPHETLEKEAARIISKLPKMTPGKQRGNAVKVPFSIPIVFKLQ